jgi:membrane protein
MAVVGDNVGRELHQGLRHTPLWVTALSVVLIALGFGPSRRSGPSHLYRTPEGRERGAVAVQSGRGRFASTPSEIPVRGWKDVLLRVNENIGKDRIVVVAAGVTFYVVLALFPAIAALIALYGLFADPITIASQLDSIADLMPGGAIEVVRDEITRVASEKNAKLGFAFIAGLLASLWSANAGMKSLFDALNLVYNESEKRNFFRLNALSLAFTISAIVFMLVALGAMVVMPFVLAYVGLAGVTETVIKVARWPALFIIVTLALAFMFRYGPSREKARWRWITWGSAFAALSWIAVSILFSWYAENFGSYNKTYGSLGAIIGFMVWIWLSTIIVLIGAELDAEMEHQTVRDTTTGRPKPMGARGARMADTVGRAQS